MVINLENQLNISSLLTFFLQRKNYFIYQQALIIKKELLLFNYFKKAEVEFLIQVLYG